MTLPLGKRAAYFSILMAVLATVALVLRSEESESAIGSAGVVPGPRFAALTLDSLPVRKSYADYAGEPLILNVWATWCDPCREEMPSFERLYRDYKARGLRIVAVSIDDRRSTPLVREFARDHGLTFDLLQDPSSDIMSTLGVRGVPETFLVSRAGVVIARRYVADWSAPASRALVDSLMALPGAAIGR